ncbi:hypothetical protein Syun_022067 [Stephania yunnanensis]|uniref:Uncharacterized protein n=1 Tax=Stephania yunnanensis TaxID=152371 RepID=A0AAP0NRP4_9MAGN
MERQEQMHRDKMERQEENREMQDRLARMEALLMQHLGIRPHVPPTPPTPPSQVTERSGPHNDDRPGHLTTNIATSLSLRTRMTTSLGIGPIHIVKCFTSRDGKLVRKFVKRIRVIGHMKTPEAMIRPLEVLYALGVLHEDAKLTSPIGFQVSEIPLSQKAKWRLQKPDVVHPITYAIVMKKLDFFA